MLDSMENKFIVINAKCFTELKDAGGDKIICDFMKIF